MCTYYVHMWCKVLYNMVNLKVDEESSKWSLHICPTCTNLQQIKENIWQTDREQSV